MPTKKNPLVPVDMNKPYKDNDEPKAEAPPPPPEPQLPDPDAA